MMLLISHRPFPIRPAPQVLAVGVNGLQPRKGISDRETGLHTLNHRLCEWTGILTAASLIRSGTLRIESSWVGTCHYRRLLWLTSERHGRVVPHFCRASRDPMAACQALTDPTFVEDVLQDHDIIVPRTFHNDRPLADQYAVDHVAEDWEVFVSILAEQYGADARRFFQRTHGFTRCGMFVMAKDRFLSYCDEALAVIEKLLVRLTPRDDLYQNRAVAFLMERFVTFTIHQMRMRAFQTPLVLLDPGQRW